MKLVPSKKDTSQLTSTGLDAIKGAITLGVGSLFGPIGSIVGGYAGYKWIKDSSLKKTFIFLAILSALGVFGMRASTTQAAGTGSLEVV